FQQLAEFGIALLQTAHGIRIERENITIRICFDRSRTWRAVQNRELTKKIPIPIECEIHLRAIVLGKSAGPSFLQDVHRSSGVALLNNEVALSKLNPLEFLDHFSKRGSRQSPEITKFVEETLERARASRHLHVLFKFWSRFGEREKLGPIQSQHFHRGATPNCRCPRPAFRACCLAEAVSGPKRSQDNFLAVARSRFHHPGASRNYNIKGVGRLASFDDQIVKVTPFRLKQRPEVVELLVGQKPKEIGTQQQIELLAVHSVGGRQNV